MVLMKVAFKKGFTVYSKENPEIAIVAPHCGPALEVTTSRDDNSETTASLLWKRIGGKLLIANVSRRRFWGVDFNRDIPPLKRALEAYPYFQRFDDIQVVFQYKKKYAWVAADEEDYYERLRIYQGFWGELEDCKMVVFVHRQFNRMKSLPGLMDFVHLVGRQVKQEKVYSMLAEVNAQYRDFFQRIEPGYKQAVFFECQRMVAEAIWRYKEFTWEKFSVFTREVFFKDMKVIQKYASPYLVQRLASKFTAENYLEASRDALSKISNLRVTVENAFDGSLALGPRRKLFSGDKMVIEVEPSQFLNQWYPGETASIIQEMMQKLAK